MKSEKQIEDQINRKTRSTLVISGIKQKTPKKLGRTQRVLQQTLSVVALTGIRILFIHDANIVHRGTYENSNLAIYISLQVYLASLRHGKLPKM